MKTNRRRFIKTSTLAGASLLLGACNAKSQSNSNIIVPTQKKKLGIALVGLGYYSSGLLAPALQLTKHCELKGIVTGTPSKIPTWQKKYGIADKNVYNYENMHEIANNDEIDVVYIVVPTGLHAKYSIIAAHTGKHVWCEKPMAMNVKECQSIIDACNKNKVKLSIGYRMQHEPNTQTVISYAKSKPFGNIQSMLAYAGYAGGGGSGWRFQKNLGGGALYDMGVYTINGIRHALQDEPIAVKSAKQFTDRPALFKEVDETTEYELTFKSGIIATGKTSVGNGYNQLKVTCENGWYELQPMQSYSGVQGQRSDGVLLNTYIENQQAKQMDDDALSIINNQEVLVPGIDGLKDIRILNAIQKSAKIGKEVKIEG